MRGPRLRTRRCAACRPHTRCAVSCGTDSRMKHRISTEMAPLFSRLHGEPVGWSVVVSSFTL